MTDSAPLVVYTTWWCPFCRRLLHQLDSHDIAYTQRDIEQSEDDAAFVRSVNRGNETVPTVLYPDGTTATNPPIAEVLRALGRSTRP